MKQLLIGIALVFFGGVGLSEYLSHKKELATNSKQTTLSCADFYKSGTKSRNVKLTDCAIDFTQFAVTTKENQAVSSNSHFYVPLQPKGADSKTPIKLLYAVESAQMRQLLHRLYTLGKGKNEQALRSEIAKHKQQLFTERTVEGWLADITRLDPMLKDKNKIKSIYPGYQGNYEVLSKKGKPSDINFYLFAGLAAIIGGLAYGGLGLRRVLKRS